MTSGASCFTHREGNTSKTHVSFCTENIEIPLYDALNHEGVCLYRCAVPTSAGAVTLEASLVDGERKGEFTTTL